MKVINNEILLNITGGWSLFGKATPYIKKYINNQIKKLRNLFSYKTYY